MARESAPMWVWMTLVILALGGLAYWCLIMFAEHLITDLG